MKKLKLIKNSCEGIDLLTQRDEGNDIRILTGNRSLSFWRRLRKLSDIAIEEIKYKKKNGWYKGK